VKDQAERLRLIAKSLQEKIRNQIYNNMKTCRVLAVTSGKGGVGKTNLALGLSLALARAGYRVMILDADMGLANIDVILGLIPKYNLAHVFRGKKKIEDILQPGPAGLQIIPGSSGIEELANLDPLALTKLLEEISAFNQKLDYLFIDTGAGISRQVLAFIRKDFFNPAGMASGVGTILKLDFYLLVNFKFYLGQGIDFLLGRPRSIWLALEKSNQLLKKTLNSAG